MKKTSTNEFCLAGKAKCQIQLSSGNYFHGRPRTHAAVHTLVISLLQRLGAQLGTALFFLSIIIRHSQTTARRAAK